MFIAFSNYCYHPKTTKMHSNKCKWGNDIINWEYETEFPFLFIYIYYDELLTHTLYCKKKREILLNLGKYDVNK